MLLNNFSAYELCFIAENMAILLIAITCLGDITGKISILIHTTKIITYFLLVYIICQNLVLDNKTKRRVLALYRGEKYLILPLNTIKIVFMNIINAILLKQNFYNFKYFLIILIIINLLYISSLKYYLVLITTRKGILKNE